MDYIQKRIADNLDKYVIGVDDEFHFKCRNCGNCCRNRGDICLSPRELFNIAKKLNMTPDEVVNEYCETLLGHTSRTPVVVLKPVGINKACPLLRNNRCMVHDAKPSICALYPLGRTVMYQKDGKEIKPGDIKNILFVIQPVMCGSRAHRHTVRSWLEKFGVPVDDQFYIKWTDTVILMGKWVRDLESRNVPEALLNSFCNFIYSTIYANYDTNQEFMPQFEANLVNLTAIIPNIIADIDAAGSDNDGEK